MADAQVTITRTAKMAGKPSLLPIIAGCGNAAGKAAAGQIINSLVVGH